MQMNKESMLSAVLCCFATAGSFLSMLTQYGGGFQIQLDGLAHESKSSKALRSPKEEKGAPGAAKQRKRVQHQYLLGRLKCHSFRLFCAVFIIVIWIRIVIGIAIRIFTSLARNNSWLCEIFQCSQSRIQRGSKFWDNLRSSAFLEGQRRANSISWAKIGTGKISGIHHLDQVTRVHPPLDLHFLLRCFLDHLHLHKRANDRRVPIPWCELWQKQIWKRF